MGSNGQPTTGSGGTGQGGSTPSVDAQQNATLANHETRLGNVAATEPVQAVIMSTTAAKAAANQARLSSLQNNIMLNPPLELPGNDAAGVRKRLRIYVPTATTVLSMGDTDSRHGHYNGFGVHTSGHILFSAMGASPDDSRMVFESMGNMVIQSTESHLFFGAKKLMALSSGENALIGGAKGVLIHGGCATGTACPLPDSRSGSVPAIAEAHYHVEHDYHKVKMYWEFIDAGVCAAELVRYKVTHKTDAKHKKFTFAPWAHTLGVVAGVGGGVFGHTGTVIHGDSGVLVGSPGFTTFFGGISMTLASIGGIFLGAGGRFELCGLKKAELVSGGSVSIDSAKTVEILSQGEMEICARTEECHLDGKNVCLGGLSSAGAQSDTASVAMAAHVMTAVQSDTAVMKGGNVAGILAKKNVHIGGRRFACLGAGEVAVFCVGESQIVMQDGKAMMGQFTKAAAAPPTRGKFPGKSGDFAEKAANALKKEVNKLGSLAQGYNAPTPGGSFIQITPSEIILKCKGHTVKGTSSGWDVPKMKIS